MIITALTGQENFPNGQCKVYLFVSPSTQFPGQEKNIGVVARSTDPSVRLVGYPELISAAPGYREDMGKWTRGTYDISENMVLKLFANRTVNGRRAMANQYLLMREGAALRRISINTTQWERGQFQSVTVEGRFDLITLREATALGVRTPPEYAHYFARTNVDQVMEIIELSPERQPRRRDEQRTVVNSAGEPVQVQVIRRPRNLRI